MRDDHADGGSERRLEIGPGSERLPGFETLGLSGDCHHAVEWGAEPLPFEDGTFAELFTSHCLEHVPWFQTASALKEAFRILSSGALIEVWVPNFEYIVRCYLEGHCGDSWRRNNDGGDFMLWANGRIFTYGPTDPNWHRAVFDERYLARSLSAAGFVDEKRLTTRTRGTSHGPIDLGMTARKP